jgi:hypothetical protein
MIGMQTMPELLSLSWICPTDRLDYLTLLLSLWLGNGTSKTSQLVQVSGSIVVCVSVYVCV